MKNSGPAGSSFRDCNANIDTWWPPLCSQHSSAPTSTPVDAEFSFLQNAGKFTQWGPPAQAGFPLDGKLFRPEADCSAIACSGCCKSKRGEAAETPAAGARRRQTHPTPSTAQPVSALSGTTIRSPDRLAVGVERAEHKVLGRVRAERGIQGFGPLTRAAGAGGCCDR